MDATHETKITLAENTSLDFELSFFHYWQEHFNKGLEKSESGDD